MIAEYIIASVNEAIERNPGAEIIYVHDEEGRMIAAVVPQYVSGVQEEHDPKQNETWRIMHAVESRAMEAGMIPHSHIEPGMF